jgi:4-amino-4-deoxy-L-arabinose transferase-like glycosyltransferase
MCRVNRALYAIAGAVTLVLVVFAGGYGYHRDELYFLEAGRHLDWSYADQGPVTPLIARAMDTIAPDSLTVLRVPSAIAAGLVVLLTGLLAREMNGSRRAQLIAATCAAVGVIVLFTGHLLSTSTFDLLAWTAITWLAVRAIRTGDGRLWIAAGVVLGIGLMNKPLPAFLAVGLLAGVAIAGPRELLRNRWVWAGALIALVIWSPWIIWQASNGWPQVDVSESITEGGSTSSEPRWALVPFQFLLISPLLAPVWIAGLTRLFRHENEYRFLAWTWVALVVIFTATGGKPYYLAGLLPALLAAGAIATDGWLQRGNRRLRTTALAGAVAASAIIGAAISLPLLPADSADPVLAVNEDVGETIGWPEFTDQVAAVYRRAPQAVIFTANYGEAGAVDRYGPARGLPGAYSGHNAFGDWGPPPASADGSPIVAIGLDQSELAAHFRGCRLTARIASKDGVDNDEDGAPILLCERVRSTWRNEWPHLRHLG